MTFTRDEISDLKKVDIVADFHDPTDEFMSDHQGNRNCFLGPRVPIINMKVGAADTSAIYLNQDLAGPGNGLRDFGESEAGGRF